MKLGFIVVLTLALGAVAANFLMQDNGYVLINFHGYTLETSVPILAFLLVLLYLSVRILTRIWRAPRQIGEAAARARGRRAAQQITRGYIEVAEGNFARGERLLTRGVRESETPLLNYLAAARAAQLQGDLERRDTWLKMAYEQEPKAASAVLLAQAELQVSNNEIEAALATLKQLQEMSPRNAEALKMLAGLYRQRQEWEELAAVLPKVKKRAHLPETTLAEWTVDAYAGLLGTAGADQRLITEWWKAVPRSLRKHPRLIRARIEAYIKSGDTDAAETAITKALANEWDEELMLLYGELDVDDIAAHLRRAEAWLKHRPDDPTLLLTAGRLCIRNELWGKARSYLESSIGIRPSPAAYHELGQLMLDVGEQDAASDAFQKGLSLSYAGSTVPKLERDLASDS
jgi:HemY protein